MDVRNDCTLDLLECIAVLAELEMDEEDKVWEVARLCSLYLLEITEPQLRIIYRASGVDLTDYTLFQKARTACSFLSQMNLLSVSDVDADESLIDGANAGVADMINEMAFSEECEELYFDGKWYRDIEMQNPDLAAIV